LTIGLFPTARTETEWSAKVTRQLEARGALVGRIAATQNRQEDDAFNTGGLSDRSARGTGTTRDIGLTGSWIAALGARTTNEVLGQLATRRLEWHTSEQDGAGISISGVADFGSPYAGNYTHDQTYVEFGDTVGHSRGSHFLKAGANVRRVAIAGTTPTVSAGLTCSARSMRSSRDSLKRCARYRRVQTSISPSHARAPSFRIIGRRHRRSPSTPAHASMHRLSPHLSA
jgi:hypothetical protein